MAVVAQMLGQIRLAGVPSNDLIDETRRKKGKDPRIFIRGLFYDHTILLFLTQCPSRSSFTTRVFWACVITKKEAMDLQLSGKNALVCGSTQGIGLASAIELARLGANVTLLARNSEKLEKVRSELDSSRGQSHRYFTADFTDLESVLAAIEQIKAEVPTIHIVINNTGGPAGGKLIDAKAEDLLKTFQMHLINYHYLAQSFVPGMQSEGFGRIVNVISTSVKQPIAGLGVSNTIRWAVAAWAKTLATELGPFGITVNNVLPGFTKTSRLEAVFSMRAKEQGKSIEEVAEGLAATIPVRRFAEASEVAAAVAFLCSPSAASINGINMPVDGGSTGSL
jgi:3-oxoacyl-[acyl-carrier protein] reductase